MKFIMSERIKHRLTGMIVIISIAVIFLPAMVKKSNRRFEETMSVSVQLPPKPKAPVVAIPEKHTLFESVQVAQVKLPALPPAPPKSQIAKMMPAKKQPIPEATVAPSVVAEIDLPTKSDANIATKPVVKRAVAPINLSRAPVSAPVKVAKKVLQLPPSKIGYGVQLASFSQKANADVLVNRLRQQGYQARYTVLGRPGHSTYKVVVGPTQQRGTAVNLQRQLASSMNLRGFIVKASG